MSREISLFANYHGKENMVTNYCGLMMKLVYEASPKKFRLLLADLLNDGTQINVGPIFAQQKKIKKSIPDLVIYQESFTIFFENKLTDWFYEEQVQRHVEGFDGCVKHKILFLLCSEFEDSNDLINDGVMKDVKIVRLTYDYFASCLEKVCSSDETLSSFLDEFVDYLNREVKDALSDWKGILDVVNCGKSQEEVVNNSVYICPAAFGPYKHKRAKYFGSYKDRAVNYVFEIDGLVKIEKDYKNIEIVFNNCGAPDSDLKSRAKDLVKKLRNQVIKEKDVQVFLLSNKQSVEFKKETKGGMFSSKKYFLLKEDVKTIDDLVKHIDKIEWNQIKS